MTIDRLATTDAQVAGDPLAGFRFTVVPHTHWDREWYQPFEVFRLRLARMLDELIDVLDREPAFTTFVLDGQAVILDDYAEVRPERTADLRRLLAAGRLVTGPSYVLPDEFLAGQEALVRNLLAGGRLCRAFGAEPMAVGYYPDTFGHVAQLPQVLRGFGIDSFVFWRGLGDEANEVGAAFDWAAPDGSRVLAIRQLGSYGNACELGRWASGGIDMAARPDLWPDVAAQRLARHVSVFAPEIRRTGSREVLVSNGSDHERVHARLPELLERVREAHPATEVAIGTFADFVGRLRASLDGALPLVEGELCSGRDAPVLRGINSTRIYLKQAAEATERGLLQAETLAALLALGGPRLPLAGGTADHGDVLVHGWRALLRNLPHDSISGCSVDRVHRDMTARFAVADQLSGRVAWEALAALAGRVPGSGPEERPAGAVAVVNTLPWRRRVLAEVPVPDQLAAAHDLRASDGRPVQRLAPGLAAVVVDLDAFGATDVCLLGGRSSARDAGSTAIARGRAIENGRLRAEVEPDGTVTLVELASGRQATGLGLLEDVADRGDEYNFCPLEGDTPLVDHGPARVRIVHRGPVVAELEVRRTLKLPAALSADRRRRAGIVRCPVITRLRLVAGSDLIEVRTTVENRARDHRLRVRFPAPGTTFRSAVRAEGHFAVVRRPPRPIWSGGGWTEPPAATHHTSGFVAAGDLVLIGRGLPEYEALVLPDGSQAIALTLLRSVGWLSRDDLATRPGGAGPSIKTPEAQCLGEHVFEYALGLGGQRRTDAELVRAAASFRFGSILGPAGVRTPRLAVRGDVGFAALKPAEDGNGAILRVYNPGGEPVGFEADWEGPILPCRLDETAVEPPEPVLRPGEIRSLRIRRPGG